MENDYSEIKKLIYIFNDQISQKELTEPSQLIFTDENPSVSCHGQETPTDQDSNPRSLPFVCFTEMKLLLNPNSCIILVPQNQKCSRSNSRSQTRSLKRGSTTSKPLESSLGISQEQESTTCTKRTETYP